MKRFRFSLRLLIVLVSALALFMGYSQYRRREILKVVAELKAEGYVFPVPDEWFDRLVWQRKPTVARLISGGLVFQMYMGSAVGTIRTEPASDEAIEKLKRLGVLGEN